MALTLVVFALLPELHQAASLVTKPDVPAHAGFVETTMVIAPSAALAIYTCNVLLSVFKPRGRTPYGKRAAASAPGGIPDQPVRDNARRLSPVRPPAEGESTDE